METIRGRMSREIDGIELTERLADHTHITIDLGTGDGRFVRRMAEQNKEKFFIGIDACRENLCANSQRKMPNMLFVIASAQLLPRELNRLSSHVSINFPWGSLLESLLNDDACLMNGLLRVTRPRATMDIHLNADALAAAGWSLEPGSDQIERVLNAAGWETKSRSSLDASDLRDIPTTWAKRLAFGRDPRAVRFQMQRNPNSPYYTYA